MTEQRTRCAPSARTPRRPRGAAGWSNCDRPEPGLTEILVAVRAAGVNPTDWRNRAQPVTVARLPLVLGWDVSGVVEAVGIGVTLFKPGDEVFGMLPLPARAGAYAEYVTAPARALRPQARRALDHVQAGRAAAGRADRLAGAGRHRRRPARAAGADPRGGRRRRPPRRADRQVPRRVRHRHRQRRQARLPARPGRRRGHRLPRRSTSPRRSATSTWSSTPIGGDYGPRSLRTLRPGGTLVSLARRPRRTWRPRRARASAAEAHARRARPRRAAGHRRPGRGRGAARRDRHGAAARGGRQGARARRDGPHHRQDRPDRRR